jgi:hypothetical protein
VLEALRRSAALFSVLLILFVARCVVTCVVSETASAALPPCHLHHSPSPEACQSHPGMLAFSVAHPAPPVVPAVTAAVFGPSPVALVSASFSQRPLRIPPLLPDRHPASLILRI